MTITLASLKEALQQPFAPETIQFLPKDIRQEQGRYLCLALPYANKRVYEDRLNELIFGEWSSPYTPPYAQGNKLIIPATVVILGVAHSDYGEAFLTTASKQGNTREAENTATEAHSQAFRRACAKFLLGRYLYDLPKLKLPYDPKSRQIAISSAKRIAWVEKLYMERGLRPRAFPVARSLQAQHQKAAQESAPLLASATLPVVPVTEPTVQSQSSIAAEQRSQGTQPTSYPHDIFLDWVARQVSRDAERIQGICTFYNVPGLAKLSTAQREELTRRLQHQATKENQPAPATPVQAVERSHV